MIMKTQFIFLLTLFLATATLSAQDINWVTMDEALALQKKAPKKIMMDVYTNWCGPCKLLDKKTFANEDVADYVNKNYYAVKFNGEGNEVVTYNDNTYSNPGYKPELAKRRNAPHQFSRFLQVKAYPTIVFFNEEAEVIAPLAGYKTPQQLELYLKMFKKDDHKNIKSQDQFTEYYEAFENEFSN